jgi:hypothetical protein
MLHSNLKTSKHETQFFRDENYFKGFDWFIDSFDLPTSKAIVNFDRSNSYFDDPKVPKRLKTFTNSNSKIVLFLLNPIERAYFYYQVCNFIFNFQIDNQY